MKEMLPLRNDSYSKTMSFGVNWNTVPFKFFWHILDSNMRPQKLGREYCNDEQCHVEVHNKQEAALYIIEWLSFRAHESWGKAFRKYGEIIQRLFYLRWKYVWESRALNSTHIKRIQHKMKWESGLTSVNMWVVPPLHLFCFFSKNDWTQPVCEM